LAFFLPGKPKSKFSRTCCPALPLSRLQQVLQEQQNLWTGEGAKAVDVIERIGDPEMPQID
jgi:hypothetical protein